MGMNMNFDFLKRNPSEKKEMKTINSKRVGLEKVENGDSEKAKNLCGMIISDYEKTNKKEVPNLVKSEVENSLIKIFAKGLLDPNSSTEVEQFVIDKIEIAMLSIERIDQKSVGRSNETSFDNPNPNETSLLGRAEYGSDER